MKRGSRVVGTATLEVDGIAVKVVRRTRQRNMYIRVKPPDAHVQVSAPARMGEARIRAFVRERRGWIDERRRAMAADQAQGPGAPTQAELAAWRAAVERDAPPLVRRWAAVLGVSPGKLAYRNMVSRWGSCNAKTGRICLNVQLAAQPPECLEYVVVHELCHLIEPNHGSRFHALLDAHLPDWEQANRKLKGVIRR